MADIVVSVGSSPVINTMNGDEYQIYKILENIEEQLSTKVDKVVGKGLSSNDYTTEEKTKLLELPSKTELDIDLSGKEDSANKVTTLDSNATDTQYPSAKAVYDKLVKKADKTTVSIIDFEIVFLIPPENEESRCGELRKIGFKFPDGFSDSYISSVIFKSGATATAVTVPSGVYCQGADCKNGAFLPKANKRYTMIFSYDGIMNCYIAAVPIQTAETQAADDFPAVNDESVAESTESVAEEPESEPNEVI